MHGLLSTLFTKAATAGLAGKVAAGAVAVAVIGGGTAAAAATVLEPTSDTSTVAEINDTTPTGGPIGNDPTIDPAPGATPESDGDGGETPVDQTPVDQTPVDQTTVGEPATEGPTDPVGPTPDAPAEPGDTAGPIVSTPEPASTPGDGAPEAEAPKDNHGAVVSSVAHDRSLSGRDHGKAVSEAARDKAAPVVPSPVDAEGPASEVDAPEAPEAPDSGAVQVSSDSSTGKGNGNGNGHGKKG